MTRIAHILSASAKKIRVALAFASLALAVRAAQPDTAPTALAALGNLPLHFEANRGQAEAPFAFIARGRNCNFFVAPNEAILTLTKSETVAPTSRGERGQAGAGRQTVTRRLRFEFLGAAADASVSGAGELATRANYFIGSDPAQWQTGVPLFARVRVNQLYPGVDLVYYGNERRLEYDFVVAPKVDPKKISLRFTGADKIRVSPAGELVFTLGREEIAQPKPVVYQIVAGVRKEIVGSYQFTDARTVSFAVGEYDRNLPLVIDPILSYSRYFGGTSADTAWDLAISKSATESNVVYVAGETMSAALVSTTGTNFSGGSQFGGDAFVAKFDLDSSSANPVYFTFVGGSGDDGALGLAMDADGDAYITGFTTSTNFPHPGGIFPNLSGATNGSFGLLPQDAFMAKLGTNGALLYATYLGGSTNDVGVGIAVDSSKRVYVTGYTGSKDFPTNNALYATMQGGQDGFVTKFNSDGTLMYSTYLGGTNIDRAEDIAADDAGDAYVTGFTASTNFVPTNLLSSALQKALNNPTNGATLNLFPGMHDAFLTKLSANGQTMLFSTYLGGMLNDEGYRVALDPAQANVFICGSAISTNFPVTAANLHHGLSNLFLADAFVAKYKADGSTNYYVVRFGGTNVDQAWDISVDATDSAHVVGVTTSTDFPTAGTSDLLRTTNSGFTDVFVTVLDSTGTNLVRSAYLGGSINDFGYALKTDLAGNDYIVGRTFSTNFPVVAPFASASAGSNDVFIAVIGSEPALNIASSGSNVLVSWHGYGFQLQSKSDLLTTNAWANVTNLATLLNGIYTVTLPPTNSPLYFRLRR